MNIVYVFIGPLPEYSVTTVHQTRLFYDGPIYFIVSDMMSPFVITLKEKYNVTIVPYASVKDVEFNDIVQKNYRRFHIVGYLKGREKLFIYAFERFFCLKQLMLRENLTDILFLELDNLIYDNPTKWLPALQMRKMAYMYDNHERSASGCCYIKSCDILEKFTAQCIDRIVNYRGFLEEMGTLYSFWEKNKDDVLYLPIHWSDSTYHEETWKHVELFNNTIFDAAAIGIFLGGEDPGNNGGVLKKGTKWKFSLIDYTPYSYKWEIEDGKRIPYIGTTDKWYRINNLHIHSKILEPLLSVPMK
jgi:hypothetical protein